MKRIISRTLGIIFEIIGIIILLNSSSNITGFIILENLNQTAGYFLSMVFIVLGFLLFITKEEWWDRYRTDLVIREYESGTLSPIGAALKINDRLYPIVGVEYDPDKGKHSVVSREGKHSIKLRRSKKAVDLALAFYEVALINDRRNAENCDIELSKRVSTKHHKAGFKKVVRRFEEKYEKELEEAKARES